jgi:hypothetical protein
MPRPSILDRFAERVDAFDPGDAMDRRCRELLDEFPLSSLLGLDLAKLASQLGVSNRTVQTGPDGQVVVRDGRFQIQVRTAMSAERRRFTFAHELGHILLMKEMAGNREDLRELVRHTNMEIERLCNRGAGRLLAPHPVIEDWFSRYPLNPEYLSRLRVALGVSWTALLIEVCDWRPSLNFYFWQRDFQGEKIRLVRSLGNRWIPDGISTRHLAPDIVIPTFIWRWNEHGNSRDARNDGRPEGIPTGGFRNSSRW